MTVADARAGAAPAGSDQASRLRHLVESLDRRRSVSREPEPDPAVRLAPVVAIVSGKGGVGKTTLSVNLSVALARRWRTTLLDADLGMANADVLCGLTPTRRLERALGRCGGMAEISIEAPGGFRLVPGAVGVARIADLTSPDQASLVDGLVELERESDVVLVDTSAGLGRGVTSVMRAADLTLVVVTPEPTSIADAYALIKCASSVSDRGDLAPIAMVVNGVTGRTEAERVAGRINAVAARFLGLEIPLLGMVRSDRRVGRAVRRRVPLLMGGRRGPASRDIVDLSAQLATRLGLDREDPVRDLPLAHAL